MATATQSRSTLAVRPLAPALGADLLGADLLRPSPSDIAFIRQALLQHLVLRFRDYSMSDGDLTRFAKRFGELEATPDYARSSPAIAGSPTMTAVANVRDAEDPVAGKGDGELHWHTDLGFTECPSTFTFLIAREIPRAGGNTSFANMYNAFERVPESLKARLRGLGVKHQASHDSTGKRRPGYLDIETDDPREMPGPVHPIIRTHPETGRQALYLGRRFGAYIPGLPLTKSETLLDEVFSYVAQPGDVWSQEWQVGDFVIWDNRCTMHRRDSFTGQGRRRMHRLMTKGDRPV